MTGLLARLACGATAVIAVGTIAACGGQKSTSTTSPSSTTTTTTAAPATSASSMPATAAPSATTPATSTVVFEVTGTGQALTIDTDPTGPPGQERLYDQPLPWQLSVPIGSDVSLLQVVAVGKDNTQPGCRITLDGKVVAEEPIGGSAHCTYQRP